MKASSKAATPYKLLCTLIAIIILTLNSTSYLLDLFISLSIIASLFQIKSILSSIMDTSIDSSTQGMENLEYLYSRCSICFEARQDYSLQKCRDQFCQPCIGKYIKEKVRSSWGLNVMEICCPVCNDVLPKSEWSRYCNRHTVELYEKYNQPNRSIVRHCQSCEYEISFAKPPITDSSEREKQFSLIHSHLSTLFSTQKSKRNDTKSEILTRIQADFANSQSGGSISITDLYNNVMSDIARWIGIRFEAGKFHKSIQAINPIQLDTISTISRLFIPLQRDARQWKELQFWHIGSFPKTECDSCEDTMCFSCGETPFHENVSCIKNMKNLVLRNSPHDSELIENIKWKLENSKQCPCCSILINRDDGCNKMDCGHCGHVFCWHCSGNFSECSFYRCTLDITRSGDTAASMSTSPAKFELGVPNVFQIEASNRFT